MAAMKICVFPDPDSPTMPTHSAGWTVSDASRTADIAPLRCGKCTLKFSTTSVGVKT
jgi:hypothetical protein